MVRDTEVSSDTSQAPRACWAWNVTEEPYCEEHGDRWSNALGGCGGGYVAEAAALPASSDVVEALDAADTVIRRAIRVVPYGTPYFARDANDALDKIAAARDLLARIEAAALPAAPDRPMRLFYSGTHGSTCINCDEYVAAELYHIPCFGQCGECPAIPHCVERRGNEPIFPAAALPAAPDVVEWCRGNCLKQHAHRCGPPAAPAGLTEALQRLRERYVTEVLNRANREQWFEKMRGFVAVIDEAIAAYAEGKPR